MTSRTPFSPIPQNVAKATHLAAVKGKKTAIATNVGVEAWKSIFPVGAAWREMEQVHRGPCPGTAWDFSHLRGCVDELLNEHEGKDAYLFACTEPQYLGEDDGHKSAGLPSGVVHIPAIIVVLTEAGQTPPEYIAVTSVQMEGELILPFRALKFKWQGADNHCNVHHTLEQAQMNGSSRNRVFALQCTQRKCALKTKKDRDLRQFEYALPYLVRPAQLKREIKEGVTEVLVSYESADLAAPLCFDFDKTVHRLRTFIPNILAQTGLTEEHAPGIEAAIRSAFKAKRAALEQEQMAKSEFFNGLDQASLDALDSIQCVKVYPKNNFVNSFKSDYVNRYYGRATKVI